jgi:single-strand DNA-binding protein
MIISGVVRIGRDCEIRFIPSGTAITNIAGVFNFGQKKDDGYRESQWVEFALWGKQAESLTQYLLKGNMVHVTAREPHIETYTKQDGTVVPKLVATVIEIELLPNGKRDDGQAKPQPQPKPTPEQHFDYNDDIPFASLNTLIKHHLV